MELHEAGVAQIAAALRAKQISPVEVLRSVFGQYRRVNPSINALVSVDEEGALRAARQSERRFIEGVPLSLLDGVPLSVKDNLFVRQLPATWGSTLYKNHVPAVDELPVKRLRDGGAVIFGKTNVPEFTLQGYTCNQLFGPTRNPWSLALTPGGSSGGAVAAVASGIGPIALATDGGGSARRPAGYTNLVGLKPSIGRIARDGGFPPILYDLEVIGLIARSVEDIRIFYNELSGAHPQDRRSWFASANRPIDGGRRRIRLHMRFADSPVDPQIVQATEQVAVRISQLGAQVEPDQPRLSPAEMASLLDVVFATGLAQLCEHDQTRKSLSESLQTLLERGMRVSGAQYLATISRIWQLRSHADHLFGEADFLLTPTSAAMPWLSDVPFPATIAGRDAGPRGHAVFTGFVNLLGLPAISLPARMTSDGLPIGFQLIARYGEESTLLDFAAAYEATFPWAHEWPAAAKVGSSTAKYIPKGRSEL